MADENPTFTNAHGAKLRLQVAADFEPFKKRVKHWVAHYGLTDWRITFENGGKNDDKFASVRYDHLTRHAHFDFHWGGRTTLSLNICALHEVLHLHVADLVEITAKRGYAYHDDVIREEHRWIEREIRATGLIK